MIGIVWVTVIAWIPNHGASYFHANAAIAGGEARWQSFKSVVKAPNLSYTGAQLSFKSLDKGSVRADDETCGHFCLMYHHLLACSMCGSRARPCPCRTTARLSCNTYYCCAAGTFGSYLLILFCVASLENALLQFWLALLTFLYVDFLDTTGTLFSMANFLNNFIPGAFISYVPS